jgi:hypothetical protein
VLQVVGVMGRDRVRIGDLTGARAALAAAGARGGRAAALGIRGRRVEARDQVAAERLHADMGGRRPPAKGSPPT